MPFKIENHSVEILDFESDSFREKLTICSKRRASLSKDVSFPHLFYFPGRFDTKDTKTPNFLIISANEFQNQYTA